MANSTRGNFAFGAPYSVMILLLVVAAIGIPAIMSYAGVRGKSIKRDRYVLGALRVAALFVLVVLFRPCCSSRPRCRAQLCRR